jgi:hypothetical protein
MDMKQGWSEWARTIVSVLLGFTLGVGWQVWRDYRQDSRDLSFAAALLKSRVANDLFLTQAVVDALRGKGTPPPAKLGRETFYPQSQASPAVGMSLLTTSAIQALDQYDKAVAGAERCRNAHVAQADLPAPESLQQRRLQIVVICFEGFMSVARDFQNLLDREFPSVRVKREPPLGASGTWHLK